MIKKIRSQHYNLQTIHRIANLARTFERFGLYNICLYSYTLTADNVSWQFEIGIIEFNNIKE